MSTESLLSTLNGGHPIFNTGTLDQTNGLSSVIDIAILVLKINASCSNLHNRYTTFNVLLPDLRTTPVGSFIRLTCVALRRFPLAPWSSCSSNNIAHRVSGSNQSRKIVESQIHTTKA
ncbi:hypothetical protein KCU77_g59, partial [Aureobasidium melanogenum]